MRNCMAVWIARWFSNLPEKKFVLFYTCIEQDAMKTHMHPESVK